MSVSFLLQFRFFYSFVSPAIRAPSLRRVPPQPPNPGLPLPFYVSRFHIFPPPFRAVSGQVFVPKENCAFMFAMTEVRCPQPPRAGETRKKTNVNDADLIWAQAASAVTAFFFVFFSEWFVLPSSLSLVRQFPVPW